jgi:uncharacterized protein YdaU (DUF1376 family)
MGKSVNFFKLYIGDYQRDTAHLSVTEHGAYLLMLQHYYATEKPLPIGKALHRMLRAQDRAEREAIDVIAGQYWRTTDAGLVNDRADAEIGKASAQADTNRGIAQAREAARKAKRKPNERSTNRATIDQPNHSQTPDTRLETANAVSARAGIGQALKRAGIDLLRINLDDPRLAALLDQGATPAEFEGIGREAVERGIAKPIGWICATLAGRREQAAAIGLAPAVAQANGAQAIEQTQAYLASQQLTPEQKLAADEARRAAMASRRAAA